MSQTTTGTPRLSEVARHLVLPAGIVSTGWPAVRETCRNLDIAFDAWQDGAGRAILGKRDDGLYAADAVVLSIPRQVGKTFLIGWIIFALCLVRPGLTVIWTAHRYKTASETYESMRAMARRPRMRPHISKVPQGAGNQAVIFRNGSRILFGARERGFGRGFTEVDVLVFDEAQILTEAAIDDMVPATNHALNPLIFYMGTPPKPTDPSEIFTRHRDEALSGEATDELYIEMSADRGADPLDRAQWAKANPSYPSRTSTRAMLRMRKNLTEDAFIREGLGIWDDPNSALPIPLDALARCVDPESTITGPVIFCLDVEVDHGMSAIAVAGYRDDGLPHAEVVDLHPGTDWLVARAVELKTKHRGARFVVNDAGPAGAQLPDLQKAGVRVIPMNAGNYAKGCGRLYDITTARPPRWRYPGPLTELDGADPIADALKGAAWRPLGDAKVWDRKNSTTTLCPLVAVTGALWGLIMRPGIPRSARS